VGAGGRDGRQEHVQRGIHNGRGGGSAGGANQQRLRIENTQVSERSGAERSGAERVLGEKKTCRGVFWAIFSESLFLPFFVFHIDVQIPPFGPSLNNPPPSHPRTKRCACVELATVSIFAFLKPPYVNLTNSSFLFARRGAAQQSLLCR